MLPPLDEFTAIAGSYQLPVSKIDYHVQEQFWNMKQPDQNKTLNTSGGKERRTKWHWNLREKTNLQEK